MPNRATPIPPAVEALRVDALKVAHPPREVRFGCADDQVVVVAHQAVPEALPSLMVAHTFEEVEEADAFVVVLEESLAGDASGRHVMDGSREFDS